MTETDTDEDRAEYLSRLGVVLQLARKHLRFSQEYVASRMGMSAAAVSRWEAGTNGIGAYDLTRLIRLYGFDADLAVNPPASKVAIRKRLGPVASAAVAAARRANLRPLDDDDNA